MKRWNDPFPATPERFHLRVEATLGSLEERTMKERHIIKRTVILVAAALLALTAVAAVVGNTRLKDALNANGAGEVAELVTALHADGGSAEGFTLSLDEYFWEDDDLYMTCSISVPPEGRYLVALYTPTLNGVALRYEPRGWVSPKFYDQESPAVLLFGGEHPDHSTELLTFSVDPALRQRHDHQLRLRAVLLKCEAALPWLTDFGGLLDPPRYASLKAAGISLDALIEAGQAEIVAQRTIDAPLDTASEQTVYNDVAEHDFYIRDTRFHVDGFRLSHTGVELRLTVSGDGMAQWADGSTQLGFCTREGRELGLMLSAEDSSGRIALADGSPAYALSLNTHALIPLKGLEVVLLAPVTYPEDAQGRQLSPVYDLDRALVLTPVFNEALPAPAAPGVEEEGEKLC